MDETIKMIITAATSSGVMSLVIYLLQKRDRKKEEETKNDTATARMLLGLAHDRSLYLTERFIRRNAITSKEKTNLKYLYGPYKELGGNGDCETGYEVCQHLKVVGENRANELDIKVRRQEFGLNHTEEDEDGDQKKKTRDNS